MPGSRPADGAEQLCCCEYVNVNGERSHILACCCDCEALDEAADKIVSCRAVPSHVVDSVVDVCVDRCRIPYFQGARRIYLDRVVPVLSVPLLLYIATYGPVQTVISFGSMPVVMLVFHRLWSRTMKKLRNDFFFYWGLTSVVFAIYVFETAVLSFREVLLWENLSVVTLTALAVYALILCRIEPGYVRRTKNRNTGSFIKHSSRRRDASRGDEEDVHILEQEKGPEDNDGPPDYTVTWVDSRPFSGGKLVTWCSSCQVSREPRSGHCTLCNWCVEGRDHHCIWINSCIGDRNHRSFIVAWCLIVFVGFYGCHLSLTSVCTPEMYLDWFLLPNDCRFVYGDIYNSIAFVTSLYILISSCLLLLGLLHQFVLIAQNLTMQEFHRANRRGMLRYGLLAQNNVNNRGVWRNIRDFVSGRRKLTYETAISV